MLYTQARRLHLPHQALSWKAVDEGWVRFDPYSGETQLLTALARFIIDLIDGSPAPMSTKDIERAILSIEPEADPGDCRLEVEEALTVLSEAQLIHIVRP